MLTQDQVEILALIAIGTRDREIAEKLCISVQRVKTEIENILEKIKAPNRIQAVLWAAKNL